MTFYRSHGDYIAHLAILLATGEPSKDLLAANSDEVEAAKQLIKRAGIRMHDEAAPAWHKRARARAMTA